MSFLPKSQHEVPTHARTQVNKISAALACAQILALEEADRESIPGMKQHPAEEPLVLDVLAQSAMLYSNFHRDQHEPITKSFAISRERADGQAPPPREPVS